MTLGLVIPVWNDQSALAALLEDVCALGIFTQIVIVDDGSDVAVVVPDMSALADIQIQVMRNDASRGPGPARNMGLAQITTSHVLFFDSDDRMTAEMGNLWADLQDYTTPFDFCIFRHCDTRQSRHGRWGVMADDAALWQAACMGGRAVRQLDALGQTALVQTANYPWNKIWHTAFLRDHAITCADIRVHEDIRPHWMGFLYGQNILASDRVAALHRVGPDADRLTNLRGPERLLVFETLRDVYSQLSQAPADKSALLPAFIRFTCRLLDWVRDTLEPAFYGDLDTGRRLFWHQIILPDTFGMLTAQDPACALHLALQMQPEAAPC